MAGSLVSDYGIGDENIQNMQLTLDQAYKGKLDAVTISEMGTTTVPQITAGSNVENNGALFKFVSNESISTTDPYTSATVADGTVYIILQPSATTITAAFTATAPTWSDSKQGYYGTGGQANNKYLPFTMTKSGTSYSNKYYSLIQKNGNIGFTAYTMGFASTSIKAITNYITWSDNSGAGWANPSFTVSGLDSGTYIVFAQCAATFTTTGSVYTELRQGGTGGTIVSNFGMIHPYAGTWSISGSLMGVITGTSFSFTYSASGAGTANLYSYAYIRIS